MTLLPYSVVRRLSLTHVRVSANAVLEVVNGNAQISDPTALKPLNRFRYCFT